MSEILREENIQMLAVKLDQLFFDIDPYEYRDQIDNQEDHVEMLTDQLRNGEAYDIRNSLLEFMKEEHVDGELADELIDLIGELEELE